MGGFIRRCRARGRFPKFIAYARPTPQQINFAHRAQASTLQQSGELVRMMAEFGTIGATWPYRRGGVGFSAAHRSFIAGAKVQ